MTRKFLPNFPRSPLKGLSNLTQRSWISWCLVPSFRNLVYDYVCNNWFIYFYLLFNFSNLIPYARYLQWKNYSSHPSVLPAMQEVVLFSRVSMLNSCGITCTWFIPGLCPVNEVNCHCSHFVAQIHFFLKGKTQNFYLAFQRMDIKLHLLLLATNCHSGLTFLPPHNILTNL